MIDNVEILLLQVQKEREKEITDDEAEEEEEEKKKEVRSHVRSSYYKCHIYILRYML